MTTDEEVDYARAHQAQGGGVGCGRDDGSGFGDPATHGNWRVFGTGFGCGHGPGAGEPLGEGRGDTIYGQYSNGSGEG